jgi:hypothetical protein
MCTGIFFSRYLQPLAEGLDRMPLHRALRSVGAGCCHRRPGPGGPRGACACACAVAVAALAVVAAHKPGVVLVRNVVLKTGFIRGVLTAIVLSAAALILRLLFRPYRPLLQRGRRGMGRSQKAPLQGVIDWPRRRSLLAKRITSIISTSP